MPYFITIYIEPIKPQIALLPISIPHAFLGFTHAHPDELDKQDEKAKQEKLKKGIV